MTGARRCRTGGPGATPGMRCAISALPRFRCFPCGVRPFCRTGVSFRRVGASRTRGCCWAWSASRATTTSAGCRTACRRSISTACFRRSSRIRMRPGRCRTCGARMGACRWRWTARSIFGPASCTAVSARRVVWAVKRSISTASSARRWLRRAKAGPCRCRRSSCVPGTGPASGTAGAAPRGVGRRGSGLPRSGCGPSIWATTSIPASRFAKRSGPQAATSSP